MLLHRESVPHASPGEPSLLPRPGRPAGHAQGHPPELSAADATSVHRFVARRVANSADAADIAQQTLLQACIKLSSFRGQDLSPWLFAIARHLIIDYYRARGRFQFLELAAMEATEPALQTAPGAVVAAGESRQRLRRWREGVTRRLCLEEQVAILLADVFDYRDKDSAEMLLMSLPCFKLLLHGARARLDQAAAEDRPAPTHRPSVTCRLGVAELLALRNTLLQGLA